jgi:uncharacterized membrane protein YphA (DoxX/SURF4 family)
MATTMVLHQPQSGMNITLWTLQILSGLFWSVTGFGKVLCWNPSVWNQTLPRVAWFSAIPQGWFVLIGICEFLGGVGLILPAMTGVKPKLTAYAAIGLTIIMALAAGFHLLRQEYGSFLPFNLVLAGVSAFIAYGRLVLRPLGSRPLEAVRLLYAVIVLAALICAGSAPVWQMMEHAR